MLAAANAADDDDVKDSDVAVGGITRGRDPCIVYKYIYIKCCASATLVENREKETVAPDGSADGGVDEFLSKWTLAGA